MTVSGIVMFMLILRIVMDYFGIDRAPPMRR